MKILLASSSPRRIELMKHITSNFKIISPIWDENNISKLHGIKYAYYQSLNKALSCKIFANPKDLIISCDTIVYFKNKIYGKPKNYSDAYKMLKELSNNTHEVITSYTIIKGDLIIGKEVISKVTFNKLTDSNIKDYIMNHEILDKAGSYAIQHNNNFPIIREISGSIENIMGFPYKEIEKDLYRLKNL